MKGWKGRGNYIDKLRFYLKGGYGGSGVPKFGGMGGCGGNIYVQAKADVTLQKTLKFNPNKRVLASPGDNSKQFVLVGKNGPDVVIPVPPGTVCSTDTGLVLGEVNLPEDKLLVCQGGDGGSPTNGFMGQRGEIHHVNLIVKTIADVGLVGFPNAGKSTLLRMISRAKPKVASYPFTTLRPHIGYLQYPDARKISMADLPGLIEGAAHNVGLGHSFLRHVERTKMMLMVVDVNGFKLSNDAPHRTAIENLLLLNKELELYDSSLLNKPSMLIVNKMDLPGANEKYDEILRQIDDGDEIFSRYPESMRPQKPLQLHEIVGISAKTNKNSVDYLKERIRKLLDIIDDEKGETGLAVHGDRHLFDTKNKLY